MTIRNLWDNRTKRRDGLFLHQTPKDNWVIQPPGDTSAIDHCPCCGSEFLTSQMARRTADFLYPAKADETTGS